MALTGSAILKLTLSENNYRTLSNNLNVNYFYNTSRSFSFSFKLRIYIFKSVSDFAVSPNRDITSSMYRGSYVQKVAWWRDFTVS